MKLLAKRDFARIATIEGGGLLSDILFFRVTEIGNQQPHPRASKPSLSDMV
jgi:hypothetical protein